ncbi:hypothetical protein FUAX_38390 (plasmid) [Fulvitalea axinellae]|uniref:Response regulator transcription factor n=1 Tax=Fulvitalea axinellae TaxID=1182444 RepID=A0AAU9D149_9BACT|nr:hypothetical protein FUAX_38390 [Fulvitalea axinellae]
MSKEKVLIVEDQVLVAEDIAEELEIQGFGILGIATSAQEAVSIIEKEVPDLVILDIRIKGELSGIDLARIISKRWKLPFIFLSANTNDMVVNAALETLPHAFLSKPFRETELHTAVEIALRKGNKQNNESGNDDSIFIKLKEGFQKIKLNDLLYLQSDGSYTRFHMANGKEFVISVNLKRSEAMVPKKGFVRIHRSYVVNATRVESFDSKSVKLPNDIELPISIPSVEFIDAMRMAGVTFGS